MWKTVTFVIVKVIVFVALAASVLFMPLITIALALFSDGGSTLKVLADTLQAGLVDGFFPHVAVAASLAMLFPSWRFLRVGLPGVAVLMLSVTVWLTWLLGFGKYPDVPVAQLRWSIVAAGLLGIVAAYILVFLLVRARRPSAPHR